MYLHNTETYKPPNTQSTRNPNVYIMNETNDPMVSAHLVSAQAIYSEVSSIYTGDVIKTCKTGQANFAD